MFICGIYRLQIPSFLFELVVDCRVEGFSQFLRKQMLQSLKQLRENIVSWTKMTTKRWITLPTTNIALKDRPPKRKLVFQLLIFRGYVSFLEGTVCYCMSFLWTLPMSLRNIPNEKICSHLPVTPLSFHALEAPQCHGQGPPETNSSPLEGFLKRERFVFQTSIFRWDFLVSW